MTGDLSEEGAFALRHVYLELLTWASNINRHGPELEANAQVLNTWAAKAVKDAEEQLIRANVSRELIRESKRAVICVIDEVGMKAFGNREPPWMPIQEEHFRDTFQGTVFTNILEELRTKDINEVCPLILVELYSWCLGCGYWGGYRDAQTKEGADKRRQLLDRITDYLRKHGQPATVLSPHWEEIKSLSEPPLLVPWQLLAGVIVLVLVACFAGAFQILQVRANQAHENFKGIAERNKQCQL